MYKAIFFDLDGTLTESGEGITKSVQYALEKLGVSASDLEPLKVFVGPPLLDQFMKYAGFDKETAQKGIEYYRERYSEKGMYENTVYPGVENALAELKRRGYPVRFRDRSKIRHVQYLRYRSYPDPDVMDLCVCLCML